MKKRTSARLLAALLCGAMAFTFLSACGNTSNEEPSGSTPPATESAATGDNTSIFKIKEITEDTVSAKDTLVFGSNAAACVPGVRPPGDQGRGRQLRTQPVREV